jgi:hypothetical protein
MEIKLLEVRTKLNFKLLNYPLAKPKFKLLIKR